MKTKFIIIALTAIVLSSCQEVFVPEYPDLPAGVVDLESAFNWVSLHVDPLSDPASHGVEEYWQGPFETMRLGTGDCEDKAILLCCFAKSLGLKSEMAVGEIAGQGHAFSVINGVHYSPGHFTTPEGELAYPFAPDKDKYNIEYQKSIDNVLYRCYGKYGSR